MPAGREGRSTSDFSTDLIGQRNSIAHGGDVRTDVEVITEIEPDSRDVAERWGLSFEGVYFNWFETVQMFYQLCRRKSSVF